MLLGAKTRIPFSYLIKGLRLTDYRNYFFVPTNTIAWTHSLAPYCFSPRSQMCLHSISIDSLSSMLWYFNVYFMIKTVVLPVTCLPKLCENSHCMTISILGTLDFQKWRERGRERDPNALRVGLSRLSTTLAPLAGGQVERCQRETTDRAPRRSAVRTAIDCEMIRLLRQAAVRALAARKRRGI
jgi:hypothetical protein